MPQLRIATGRRLFCAAFAGCIAVLHGVALFGADLSKWFWDEAHRDRLTRLEERFRAIDPSFSVSDRSMKEEDRLLKIEHRVAGLGAKQTVRMVPIQVEAPLKERFDKVESVLLEYERDQKKARETWMVAGGISVAVFIALMLALRRWRRSRSSSGGRRPKPDGRSALSDGATSAQKAAARAPDTSAETKARVKVQVPAETPPSPPSPPRIQDPAIPPTGKKLFISFSTSDLDFVEHTLVPQLAAAGHSPWFSVHSIRPSDLWERSILAGLEGCDFFLVIMSPHAISSKWVQLETHWATENRDGRIIPLMLVRCDPWKLHMKLGNLQYIDFERAPDAMADLLDIIAVKGANIGA